MGPGPSPGKRHRGSLTLSVCQSQHPRHWRFDGLCTHYRAEEERNHLIPHSEGWKDWHLDSFCPPGQLGFCKIQMWHAPVKQFSLKADLKNREFYRCFEKCFFSSPFLAEAQEDFSIFLVSFSWRESSQKAGNTPTP